MRMFIAVIAAGLLSAASGMAVVTFATYGLRHPGEAP